MDLIGIARADFDDDGEKNLQNFIQDGRQGTMDWLKKDFQKRVNPQQLLPGAKSVIVIGINYYREPDADMGETAPSQAAKPLSRAPSKPAPNGRIARYAYGRDYHKVLKKLLKQIAAFIEQNSPPGATATPTGPEADSGKPAATPGTPNSPTTSLCKICVDSSPILEKSYAVKAGLGFIGKNTTLITPEFGSFVLLGEILTTIPLTPDEPKTGTCGTCTRCLDACPTQAIIKPNILDARRCISYLTIEHKDEIAPSLQSKMGNWIFGCDICQEVCPYNKVNAKPLQLQAFKEVKIAGSSIPLQEIFQMKTDQEFLQRFAGSPLMRAKRAGLQRNAKIAQKNLENI